MLSCLPPPPPPDLLSVAGSDLLQPDVSKRRKAIEALASLYISKRFHNSLINTVALARCNAALRGVSCFNSFPRFPTNPERFRGSPSRSESFHRAKATVLMIGSVEGKNNEARVGRVF